MIQYFFLGRSTSIKFPIKLPFSAVILYFDQQLHALLSIDGRYIMKLQHLLPLKNGLHLMMSKLLIF